jgi:hypothetical protein
MKLGEIYEKPLKEILESFDLVKENIHTNDNGDIQSIELKYAPKGTSTTSLDSPPAFRSNSRL